VSGVSTPPIFVAGSIEGSEAGAAEHMAYAARMLERERILRLASKRREQYTADGWQQQADAITLFMAEIQR
jgi:hypothetical protein